MKFTNKKAIFFDLDGTLINSALDLAKAVNFMLQTLKYDTFEEDTIHRWVGNGALTLVKRALSGDTIINKHLDEDEVTHALEVFLDFYGKNICVATKPYPNVLETLQNLKVKNYTLAIITNKPFDFVAPILETLGLDNLFEVILGGDSLAKKKPDPMPLLHVCEQLNVNVEACVMVGDSKNDILAANACGMQSVGVTYGYNYGESIGVYNPTHIVNDFGELNNVL
ncbi:MAG: Phosphoglycolate phosphatase (EC [uncultured Sulfurovum sp.]|uniref:Phosphoglycolate phosphatase n=1 Tax=uncultured Sulfurovum sp. TaxID=269237 RepID=A0A6S6U8G3_9BACT|nr:MAG: Phosphoglycolate phosphatase (EC [uncultured Sulfurovum sp.]